MDDSLDFPGDTVENPVTPLSLEEVKGIFSEYTVTQGTGKMGNNMLGITINPKGSPNLYEIQAHKEGIHIGIRSAYKVGEGYNWDYTFIRVATDLHQALRIIKIEENWCDTL